MSEQIEPRSNLLPSKKRGRNKSTLVLIEAMRKIAEETHPITGRGIGYKLFAAGLIGGMNEMNVVYRALKIAAPRRRRIRRRCNFCLTADNNSSDWRSVRTALYQNHRPSTHRHSKPSHPYG